MIKDIYILIDISDETIRIQKFHSSQKLWWNITEIATLPKSAYLPNYQRYRWQILKHKLKTWMKIVSKFHVLIFYTFTEISRQRALSMGRAGLFHRFKWFSYSKNSHRNLFHIIPIFIGGLRTDWMSCEQDDMNKMNMIFFSQFDMFNVHCQGMWKIWWHFD